MPVITTYLNDNAQTPLGRFVDCLLYNELCNKYNDKPHRWNLGISLSVASTAVGTIGSSPSATTLLIATHRVAWRIVSNSTVVRTKMGHVSKTTPILRVIFSSLWQDLKQSPFVQNLTALASAIPGAPKIYFKTCHVT